MTESYSSAPSQKMGVGYDDLPSLNARSDRGYVQINNQYSPVPTARQEDKGSGVMEDK